MTLEATIDRPADEAHGMPRRPAGQKPRPHLDKRVERLTAELERQGEMMHGACMVAEDLRGLALMFFGVFCDTPLTEDAGFRAQRVAAAYPVESMLKSMADRLDSAQNHADTSRKHILAEVAR